MSVANPVQKICTDNTIKDAKLPNPSSSLNTITSPAEVNSNRKVNLTDATIQALAKDKLYKLSTHEVTYRMVVDFTKINKQLEYWSYPLMKINKIFSNLDVIKLFSTLNVKSGYYNITVAEDGRKYILEP